MVFSDKEKIVETIFEKNISFPPERIKDEARPKIIFFQDR